MRIVDHTGGATGARPRVPATLDAEFRANEELLRGLGYRMTGVAADADEVVQETFLRALEQPVAPTPWRPWLLRVATNLAVDFLRRRRRREYVGPWLPSPIETDAPAETPSPDGFSPEARYALRESVSYAFLVALEALSPRARAVLLLRDVFDYSAAEVAAVLDTTEANVRVLHHRARKRMQEYDRERCLPTMALHERTREALERFLDCLVRQDVAGIESLLAESARTITDAGGEYTALASALVGRERVASFHLKVAKRRAPISRIEIRTVNGLPAAVIETRTTRPRQAPRIVLRCELDSDGRIRELHSILASRKLAAIRFSGAT